MYEPLVVRMDVATAREKVRRDAVKHKADTREVVGAMMKRTGNERRGTKGRLNTAWRSYRYLRRTTSVVKLNRTTRGRHLHTHVHHS